MLLLARHTPGHVDAFLWVVVRPLGGFPPWLDPTPRRLCGRRHQSTARPPRAPQATAAAQRAPRGVRGPCAFGGWQQPCGVQRHKRARRRRRNGTGIVPAPRHGAQHHRPFAVEGGSCDAAGGWRRRPGWMVASRPAAGARVRCLALLLTLIGSTYRPLTLPHSTPHDTTQKKTKKQKKTKTKKRERWRLTRA